ncbi:MAG: prolyl oligopeptidase family serine peptidase [Planctomycetota bacterium]|nr:prolyl oligopeptidase family serine peptidase [Planctomycetota bacterium]
MPQLSPFARAAALLVAAAAPALAGSSIQYPVTKKVDQKDTYHGTVVEDPYRWLEDDVRNSSDVREWVDAQNKVTFAFLESIPERKAIEDRLTKLWNYERYSPPSRQGDRYVFSKNDGLQNQSVLYVMDSLNGEPRVLLDPNKLSADGTVALSGVSFSDDGNLLAYGLASAGSDWNQWHVRDVRTGQDLTDHLKWIKFSGASWTTDNKGFFYSRYPEPEKGKEFQALNHFMKVYYHRIGTPQTEDILVYENPSEPEHGFGAGVTEDGKYVVVSTFKGTDNKNLVHWASLENGVPAGPDKFTPLIDRMENDYSLIGNDGSVLFFRTDLDAPKGRVIAIDLKNPAKENWKTIIPEAKEVLLGAGLVGDRFFASYLKDASTRVRVHAMDGSHLRDVEFPAIGSAGGFGGKRDHKETFYSFSSFAYPPSIYRYDIETGKSELMRRAAVDLDPEAYETKQVFYPSKDGTKVPMFITHKKGLKLDGSNPTLLYAYGGFDIPLTPTFSISRLAWLEMGGVYVLANLRGGGEYGREWHEAGKRLRKQNVFDDFIAAGEWLVQNKYTRPDKLAIQGGSNGGLLVGAVMVQRPDLFGAALPAVGVMDMLRFHSFSAGRFWVDEYGSSDDPEMFPYLLGYSPYHSLLRGKEGTRFPSTLITTADTDDRVVPGHSFKFAAALQEKHRGENPVLIRIETKAGHGAGKPTSKLIEETADQIAFLVKTLRMNDNADFKVHSTN